MLTALLPAAAFSTGAPPARAETVAPPAGGCHYEVALGDAAARRLDIAMICDGEGPFRLATDRHRGDAHVVAPRGLAGSTLAKSGDAWLLKGADGQARAAYRFDIDGAVAAGDPRTGDLAPGRPVSGRSPSGRRVGASVVTRAGAFLLVPEGGARAMTLSLRFRAPAGAAVRTAFAPREGAAGAIAGVVAFDARDLPLSGFLAMGRLESFTVPLRGRAGEARLDVVVLDAPRRLATPELRRWIAESAARVGDFFGGFPVPRALIVIEPVPGARHALRGLVMGGGGATMLLRLGAETEAGDLPLQWMLMHELVHFGGPQIGDAAWLMEGMAVYVETRLRVAAGWFPADQAWRGFLRNVRHGVPAMEQQGLDRARGIGPIYWGGTLFMLLADAAIIEKSNGAKSLDDCFRAVLAAGGDATAAWSAARFIAACDAATGSDTMRRLAGAHAANGTRLDLAAFWARLGVQLTEYEAGVKYDDTAPLAWVRKKIMAGPPSAR